MDTRKQIAKSLYKVAYSFFLASEHKNSTITFREVHLSPKLRADILNVSWDDKVVIIELKTCKEDFKLDDKWQGYLDYCDYFYFMCPENVIKKEEIPFNVGLIYVKNGAYFVVQNPKKLCPKRLNSSWFRSLYKKLAFRKMTKVGNDLINLESEKLFENL